VSTEPHDGDKLSIDGITIGVSAAGIRYQNRNDLVIFELCDGSTIAATFTRNRFAAAPVYVARQHLQNGKVRYLLINAGNANAGTGQQGMHDALDSCAYLAEKTGLTSDAILPFSTGVIGEYLPMDKLCSGIDHALDNLVENGWQGASKAIMTTDTKAKLVSHQFTLNGKVCNIVGIAKGSGMIHPDMATMLAFIATDAGIPQQQLDQALAAAVDDSFNCITVDGDTSTNDACVAIATGQGEVRIGDDPMEQEVITAKLTLVCKQLAELIVRDAEGATKLARIKVTGGRNKHECKTIGYTIALSPLVKTALFGQDPNWGRILAAVGRAPVDDFDLSRVDIYLDEICIIRKGERDRWYSEEDGARVMQRDEITISVNMAMGDSEAEILTSDLSHDYVSINADYRS
jgi:glutamate N-acetyltransferase/amino-acid N-acetyltransferase